MIENKDILELPLNGRDPLQLVSLSPNVTVQPGAQGQGGSLQGGTRAAESIAISGQRNEFNYYTIDGVANQDVNFNSYIVGPSVEALLEFKVQMGVFPAEYGRQPSQILMATRSGTNVYHATVFEFLRNSDLDAKIWNQVGAKIPSGATTMDLLWRVRSSRTNSSSFPILNPCGTVRLLNLLAAFRPRP
jgi:hypothetical protein